MPSAVGIGMPSEAAPTENTVARWRRRLVCDSAWKRQYTPRLMPLPGRESLRT